MERLEIAKMLIRFYNMRGGCSISSNAESNQKAVFSLLEKAGEDVQTVSKIKDHMREWVEIHKSDDKPLAYRFKECLDSFEIPEMKQVAEISEDGIAIKSELVTDAQVESSLGILERAVVNLVASTSADKIEHEIMGQVQQTVKDFVKSEYGTIERKIVTVVDGKKAEMEGVLHEKFDTVLKFVANNEPVFLTGPAGAGKNFLCKQVAEALGLKFYFTNAVTQEYKLTGFTDAMGNFQETQFYNAFTEGGLFMLDEMDASIPEVLVILNAAIANRYFDFPAPIGYVEAHPDFRVVAAGNTFGHGADFTYVGRNQLDGASLDRFALVNIDYSETIENAMAYGDTDLVEFCREYRNAAVECGLQTIVSYRAISRLAKMSKILDTKEALETCLTKGLSKDDLNIIAGRLSASKYSRALKELAKV